MKLLKTKKDKIQFLDWIAALEAEAVPQTQECLEDERGMCCLGVAVALMNETAKMDLDIFNYIYGIMPVDQKNSAKWLKSINDDFKIKTGSYLSTLNDQQNLTFPQIAGKLMEVYAHELEGLYE